MTELRRITTFSLLVIFAAAIVIFIAPDANASCGGIETAIISCDDGANPTVEILKLVLRIFVGLVGFAAVGALIFAGIIYSTAGGEQARVTRAKTMIRDTVIGIVLFGTMFLFANWLMPGGLFGGDITSGSSVSGGTSTGSSTGSKDTATPTKTQLSSFSIASWNVWYPNGSDITAKVKALFESADIVSLQEVHLSSMRSKISDMSCNGCKYEKTTISGSSTKESYPILWKRSVFEKLDQGVVWMCDMDKYIYHERFATWVKLKEKKSGKEFYVINNQLPPGVESGSGWSDSSTVGSYKTYMSNLAKLVESKKKDNLPIFITGDFNVDYRDDKSCKIADWACRKLGKAYGIYPAWHFNNLSGISKSQGTLETSSRLIDYVMVPTRDDIGVKSTHIIGGSGNGWGGSDHKPSIATIALYK